MNQAEELRQELRPQRVKEKVTLFDHYGRPLFTIDKWIYDVALERGDLARWFRL